MNEYEKKMKAIAEYVQDRLKGTAYFHDDMGYPVQSYTLIWYRAFSLGGKKIQIALKRVVSIKELDTLVNHLVIADSMIREFREWEKRLAKDN